MKKNIFRDAFFPQKAGKSIAGAVEKHRKQEATISDIPPEVVASAESRITGEWKEKPEAYAIMAYFFEKIYALMPPNRSDKRLRIYSKLVYPPEPHLQRIISPHTLELKEGNTFGKVVQIAHAFPTRFIDGLARWSEAMEQTEEGSYDRKVYDRLVALLGTNVRNHLTVQEFMRRGAITAGQVPWDIMRAIPIAYYRQYGHIISKKEFTEIAEESESIVATLASLHLEHFQMLLQFTNLMGSPINRNAYLEMPLEFVQLIKGADGTLRFVLDEARLEAFQQFCKDNGMDVREGRYRCPALEAKIKDKDGDSLSLVSYAYKEYIDLAQQYLVPHLQRYTRMGILQQETPRPESSKAGDIIS